MGLLDAYRTMGTDMDLIAVQTWTVGVLNTNEEHDGHTLLGFKFSNREPINLVIPPETAEQIAKTILEQVKNRPPRRDRLS